MDLLGEEGEASVFPPLLMNIPDGVVTFDALRDPTGDVVDLRVLGVNPAFERLTGLPAHQVTGKPMRDALPSLRLRWFDLFSASLEDGEAVTVEGLVVDLGRHFRATSFPTGPGQIAIVFVDVTPQKETEARLAMQARRAQALLELPGLAETLGEPEFMQRGVELAEALTASSLSFVHFVSADQARVELVTWSRRALAEHVGRAVEAEYPLRPAGPWADAVRGQRAVTINDFASHPAQASLPDTPPRLQRVLCVPTRDGGAPVMLTGVGNKETPYSAEDVETVQLVADTVWYHVQRRRAQRALEESEERLKLALAAAELGIYDLDLVTGDVLVSPEYATMLGYAPDTFRETKDRWLERLHPDDRAPVEAHLGDYLAGRRADYRVEFRQRARDGRWRWLLSVGRIVARDEAGRPLRMLGTHLDITGRRAAEDERVQLQSSLAEADRLASMGRLAAGVAHEVNNPLSFILYNLESLAEDLPAVADAAQRCLGALAAAVGAEGVVAALGQDRLPRLQREVFEDMVSRAQEAGTGARRIKQIIRGLATFSQVDRGVKGPVDVTAAIEHALSMTLNELRYRARVSKVLQPVPRVLATEGQLAQLFLNLFMNAAQAIEEGHVEANLVRVRAWAEGGNVLVEIEDTGRGIPAKDHARVFEPFYVTGAGLGPGLGLSISRSIAVACGGDVTLRSEPGVGSCFRVVLPAAAGAEGSVRRWPAPPTPTPTPPQPAVARGRVLVVDDEPGIRQLVARLLRDLHDVELAGSGEEAKALLERDPAFDAILCDLMMPRMSGLELHAWMRAEAPELAPRVIFMTGGTFTPGAAEYLGGITNRQLDKPFERRTLTRAVDEMVKATRAAQR